jgi:Peptidase family M28
VPALTDVQDLVAFEGRASGTDAERQAAEHLAQRLRGLGRDADIEPVSVYPRWALTHAIHAALAVAGSIVSVGLPAVGIGLVLLALFSTLGDLTGTVFLVRRLTGRRASQNVVSREDGGKGAALVLVAHYDAAHGGLLYDRRFVERRATVARRLRLPIGLGAGFLIAMVVVLLCTLARGLGAESLIISIIQFIPTVGLIVGVLLLLDAQLSAPVPAAADNAAGVAVVLELVERHGGQLEHLDLWALFTGAEESMALGMREWIRAHRTDLPSDGTIFLNIDKAGNGTVRYTSKEGFVLAAGSDGRLLDLCEQISEEDEDGRFGAREYVSRASSDAVMARARGYPAITVSALAALDYQPNQHQPTDTPDRVDEEAMARVRDFCSSLIERIDQNVGPEAREAAG